VPGYQEMLDLVAEAAKRYLPKEPKIIDLGCGTGNASSAILNRISANIFLIDGSGRMVNAAAEKITRQSPYAIQGTRVANLSRNDWDAGLGHSTFDAIVSTLVLEHLPFDRYRAVIEKCYHLLKPGGWLLAAEGYVEEGSDMQEWFFQEMGNRHKERDPDIFDFVARRRDENEAHYYCSKAEKGGWWRDAGFEQINILWQYLCIALMAGRKPSSRF
jgi:cyclopropane fatty-acyl-phospholipid synthase-like methyltransferase